jgi:pimeloyl-ACP methyl ester carboxylesterase
VSIERPRFRVRVADGLALSVVRRDQEGPAITALRRGAAGPPMRIIRREPEGLAVNVLHREPVGPSLPTFLLVHGLASNARTWDGVADELARLGHPSVAVDLRGHGRSDKPDDGYDVPSVAEDVCALIERLHLERPILCGQSWGGNVVIEVAASRPDLVRGVVAVDGGTIELAEAYPDWEACWTALAPPRLAGTPVAELEDWIRAAHPDWPESGISGALASFELRTDGTGAPWLTRERHRAVLRGLWEHSPSRRYADIRVPVLLCPAESERDDHARAVSERHHVEAALAAIPRVRVHWFRGADHDIHAQRPAELARVMADAVADGFLGP